MSLFGGRAPAEVQQLWKHLKDVDRDTFGRILTGVVTGMDGEDCCDWMTQISETGLVSEQTIDHVVAGLYMLLRETQRLPSLKQELLREELEALRFPEELITDLCSEVVRRRQLPLSKSLEGPSLPKMKEFNWRVDVAISTSSLSRALQPSILMQIKLSDGRSLRFEVPVAKFQELRYNVALVLKEMQDAEKKTLLKTKD